MVHVRVAVVIVAAITLMPHVAPLTPLIVLLMLPSPGPFLRRGRCAASEAHAWRGAAGSRTLLRGRQGLLLLVLLHVLVIMRPRPREHDLQALLLLVLLVIAVVDVLVVVVVIFVVSLQVACALLRPSS